MLDSKIFQIGSLLRWAEGDSSLLPPLVVDAIILVLLGFQPRGRAVENAAATERPVLHKHSIVTICRSDSLEEQPFFCQDDTGKGIGNLDLSLGANSVEHRYGTGLSVDLESSADCS